MTQGMRRELVAAARSNYWSEDDGRTAVTAWRESGESATRFGARHGLSARRLRWWARRLGTSAVSQVGASSASTRVELIPIEMIQREVRGAPIEIAIGEIKVRVDRGVDADALRTVIEVLRAC
jgi:hypothetical protein